MLSLSRKLGLEDLDTTHRSTAREPPPLPWPSCQQKGWGRGLGGLRCRGMSLGGCRWLHPED